MKNVTLSLKENVARWARIKAAEQGKSLSKFLGDLLEERMRHESDYEAARRRFMAGSPSLSGSRTKGFPRAMKFMAARVFR